MSSNPAHTRMERETIQLVVGSDANSAAFLEQFRTGIYIGVAKIRGGQVRLSIEARAILLVLRGIRFVGSESEK